MSTLKFWNKQSNNSAVNQNGKDNVVENGKTGSSNRNWLHQPDALKNGHVAYLVKYLGNIPVDQPKGIEVVKEAIRKLQFTQQLKKAESGSNYKTKKVEITVSIDGVAIQEPRTNNILHQFPLHKISYCADEKGAKKFFSFIAKTGNGSSSAFPNGEILSSSGTNSNGIQNGSSGNGAEEGHECFVFISNKLASDITLTIGQAFDLAYKRYVNDNGKTMEMSKLQSQNRQLENTVTAYRQRLRELSEVVNKNDLERLLVRLGLRDILEVPQENGSDGQSTGINGSKTPDLGIDVSTPSNDDQLLIETSPKHFAPIVPPRNQNPLQSTLDALKPSVGTKLEGLLLNSDSDSDFDPRAEETDTSQNGNKITNDLFGYEPPKQSPGQQIFTNNLLSNGFSNGTSTNGLSSPPPLLAPPPKVATPRRNTPATNNGSASQDLFGSTPFQPTIQPTPVFGASFKTGLSFDDFTLESLDPLSSK
uniref:CSON012995 protein n=1 Tax=Culicoides sonorensis TaxID=179676 RepID=A0A336LRE2_CULSO